MSIFSKIINALNGKGFVEIKEDAEPDDIASAIEGAQSMEQMKQQITSLVTEAVTASFQSQLDAVTKQLSEQTAQLEIQGKELESMKQANTLQATELTEAMGKIQALQAENETLKAQNKELSGKLAGKMADWKADGDAAPSIPSNTSSKEAFMKKQEDLKARRGGKKAE